MDSTPGAGICCGAGTASPQSPPAAARQIYINKT